MSKTLTAAQCRGHCRLFLFLFSGAGPETEVRAADVPYSFWRGVCHGPEAHNITGMKQ